MSSDQPQPIGPESGRPPVALTVATVVALSQVLAFYLAIRLAASFRIPFRRGIFFLGVLLAAGAIASAAVRAVTHHHGSGYAIPLFASGGFVAAFAVNYRGGHEASRPGGPCSRWHWVLSRNIHRH